MSPLASAGEKVFVIDHSRCIGCKACVQACGECDTHRGLPMIHLEYIDRAYSTQTMPTVCMHCETPTCAEVCPADAIKQELPALRAQLPAGAQLLVVSDTSTSIRTAIAGVQEELITAVVLTALILLLFLHLLRVSFIVLLSIPTTLLAQVAGLSGLPLLTKQSIKAWVVFWAVARPLARSASFSIVSLIAL